MKQKTTIVFFGTASFARIVLQGLTNSEFQPIAVVTEPDRPAGRGKQLTSPPVKEEAQQQGIRVFQPDQPVQVKEQLEKIHPDLFIVAAYGEIIRQDILDIPTQGSLGIHPSLLPRHRGASPVQTALLQGDQQTGVTIYLMDEKMDHGPIISQAIFDLSDKKLTCEQLDEQLARLGAGLLLQTLPLYLTDKIKPQEQDHAQATFTKKISKEQGKIDWQQSAEAIERMIRAYYPWPSAYTTFDHKRLKVVEVEAVEKQSDKKPGTIFLTEDKQVAVACGKNLIILQKVQPEGKRIMSGQDFIHGHQNILGYQLE